MARQTLAAHTTTLGRLAPVPLHNGDRDPGLYVYAVRPPVSAEIARSLRRALITICNHPRATFKGAQLSGAAPLMGNLLWAAELVPNLASLDPQNGPKLHRRRRSNLDEARASICRRLFYDQVAAGSFPAVSGVLKCLLTDPEMNARDQAGHARHAFFPSSMTLTGRSPHSFHALASASESKGDGRLLAAGKKAMETMLENVPYSPDGRHLQRAWWHARELECALRQDLQNLGRSGFDTADQATAFISGLSVWWGTATDAARQRNEGIYYGLLHHPDGGLRPNLWEEFLTVSTNKQGKKKTKCYDTTQVEQTRLALAALAATLNDHTPKDPELVEAATAAAFRARQLPRPDFLVGTLLARFMIDWPIASPTVTHGGLPPPGTPAKGLAPHMQAIEAERREALRQLITTARRAKRSLVEHDMIEATHTFITGRNGEPGRHSGAMVKVVLAI